MIYVYPFTRIISCHIFSILHISWKPFHPLFSATCARLILWKISPDWNSANLVTRLRRGAQKIGMYPLKGKVICKISANVSHHDDTMANHGWRDTRTGYELLCCILDVSAMSVCQHIGLASFSSCRYLLGMQILTLTRERKLELEILVYIPRFS